LHDIELETVRAHAGPREAMHFCVLQITVLERPKSLGLTSLNSAL